MKIQSATNKQIVVVHSSPRFEKGAVLTQEGYTKFLALATEQERATHTAALADPGDAGLLGLEFFGSLDVH
jgi:hypothetical protein